ncbi:AMP-binding protein [Agarilytica rhodophyticola]|uniref:AMP-binding protein n=1 Tax=Agarilytica rhodophyticola TaxID=1737490 RepID=UPI000B348036|nr:AMP-binding protein [Agarilytica rhodophyticola]
MKNNIIKKRNKLITSESILALNDETVDMKFLLEQGREQWKSMKQSGFSGLVGLSSIKMIAALYSALVDNINIILADTDTHISEYCSEILKDNELVDVRKNREKLKAIKKAKGLAVLSSGSLGQPKLIFHNRNNFVKNAYAAMQRLDINKKDRVLITVPVHHMYGLGAALIPSILGGAEILLLPKANILNFNEAIKNFKPTITFSTPHLLRSLLRRERPRQEFSRGIVLAGDGIPAIIHNRAKSTFGEVFNLYGSSELGVIAISRPSKPKSLIALDKVEISAKKKQKKRCVLLVKHPYRATHILNHEKLQETKAVWNTKDIATIADDSSFRIHGRADLSINRSGKLLVLADLERKIMSWQDVNSVVVISSNNAGKRGQDITALVKADSQELTEAKLKQFALDNLPTFARPDNYKIINNMPFLKSGKPDRKALVEEYQCG